MSFASFLRKKILKRPTVPPKEIGHCFYCKLPVLASPGQAIKFKRITQPQGEPIFHPTHKKCRKHVV